jgi:hypothetical protein
MVEIILDIPSMHLTWAAITSGGLKRDVTITLLAQIID